MVNIDAYRKYADDLKAQRKASNNPTEHQDRDALINLLKSFPGIIVSNEAEKSEGEYGKPDIKITRNNGAVIVGYIETKPFNTDLNSIINGTSSDKHSVEQLNNYKKVYENLILTNYNEFIAFRDGKEVRRETIFKNLETLETDDNKINLIDEILNTFLSFNEAISSPKRLAIILAKRASLIKEYFTNTQEELKKIEENELYGEIKENLLPDLQAKDFADIYAQIIVYGAFLTRLLKGDKITDIGGINLYGTPLNIIDEFFSKIKYVIPRNIEWILGDLLDIVNAIDVEKIAKDLSMDKEYDEKDPYVYFYENFLAEYNKAIQKDTGTFYTPIPVVENIINNVDYILQTDFVLEKGLGDDSIRLLDFASGTGTFLVKAYEKALSKFQPGEIKAKLGPDQTDEKGIIIRFDGFELQLVPFIISQMKIYELLKNKYNVIIDKNQRRPQIFLTNSLDISESQAKENAKDNLTKEINYQAMISNKIKKGDIHVNVVIGNPPYYAFSKNNSPFIMEKMEDYKENLNEKKPQLNDDYVKFIRLAQDLIDKNEWGVVGIITNNSYLDGLTHRVMREKLYKDFDKIYIINLHGNSRIGETDENVFDIQVGTSIVFFVKLKNPLSENKKKVYYFSTLENGIVSRKDKYAFLKSEDGVIDKIKWIELKPESPNYWFVYKDLSLEKEYQKYWKLTDIFEVYGTGVKTGNNDLFIDAIKKSLMDRMKHLYENTNDAFIKYRVQETKQISLRDNILKSKLDLELIKPISYRPFDDRFVYYNKNVISRARYNICKNIKDKNLVIGFLRRSRAYNINVLISNKMLDHDYITNGTYFAPLYLNDDHSTPNFTKSFSDFVSKNYSQFSPKEILSYIYAILWSSSYRAKYSELLKIDFPRVKFIDNIEDFKKLVDLGQKIIEYHLLGDSVKQDNLEFPEDGTIANVKYEPEEKRIYFNPKNYIGRVDPEVYNFEIGSYKVIDHYIKSRKNTEMSLWFETICKISTAIKKTLELQEDIDEIVKKYI